MRSATFGTAMILCSVLLCRAPAAAQCVGDCAGDGQVTINDLILGVNIALGSAPVSECQAFANEQGEVTISQLIRGVNNALDGCPPPVATATATDTAVVLATATATATGTSPPLPTATLTGSRTATATRTATGTLAPTATRTTSSTRTTTATVSATPTATGPTPTPTNFTPCFENDDCPLGQVCVENFCIQATATATPTASATATATGQATATVTATGAATATHSATVPPTSTATSPPSATATRSPSATATQPTATATAPSSATATATAPSSPTATATSPSSPTSTATAPSSPTATATSPPTQTATASATRTGSATASATPTATATRTATETNTPTVTIPPSSTPLPPGEAVGGRAAFVSSGLGGIQALVGAVAAILNNDGGAALLSGGGVGGVAGLPPGSDACPINGSTMQECTKDPDTVVHLTLSADQCVANGPASGRVQFDGGIMLDSSKFLFNSCSPKVVIVFADFLTNQLTVEFSDDQATLRSTVTADMNGTVGLGGPIDPNCIAGSLTLVLNGTLTTTLANGQEVGVSFFGTNAVMSGYANNTGITYNADCVPIAYRITFNGNASFAPSQGPPALVAPGGVPSGETFNVTFTNFVLKQDASSLPVEVEMSGGLTSDCYGGLVSLQTFAPIAIGAGDLCPDTGQLNVTGSGMSMATVVYDDGMVQVTPSGGQPVDYPSCFAPALLMCQPQ